MPHRRAILTLSALVPVATVVLLFFPQALGLDVGAPPPLVSQLVVLTTIFFAAGTAAQTVTQHPPPRTALVASGPALVLGGFLGAAAALEPMHLTLVAVLVVWFYLVSFAAAFLVARRRDAAGAT